MVEAHFRCVYFPTSLLLVAKSKTGTFIIHANLFCTVVNRVDFFRFPLFARGLLHLIDFGQSSFFVASFLSVIRE